MNKETQKTEETNSSKAITPPYLGLAKLDQVFELVSSRNFEQLTIDLFMSRGFSKIDSLLAVSMFRFLGIIDDEGKATKLMEVVRQSKDKRKPEFEKIFRTAYQKLYAIVPKPHELSNKDLLDDFRSQYGLSLRVAQAAIPDFLKLAEYAGLKEEGSIVGRTRKPKNKENKANKEKKSENSNQLTFGGLTPSVAKEIQHQFEFSPTPMADGRVILLIPSDLKNRLLDNEKLNADWFVLQKAVKTFADLHIPKQKSDPQESETK